MDTLTSVRAVLSTTAARWTSLAEKLPADLMSRQPAAGEWSALECLQHIIDTEREVFSHRLQAFLDGRDFPGFDPSTQGTTGSIARPATALAAEFAGLRAANLTLLATVKPSDLARRVRHQELGPVALADMLNEWTCHDVDHLMQAERALMQPFIASSGPWKSYFVKHLVGQ
jgi:DinB superfamily